MGVDYIAINLFIVGILYIIGFHDKHNNYFNRLLPVSIFDRVITHLITIFAISALSLGFLYLIHIISTYTLRTIFLEEVQQKLTDLKIEVPTARNKLFSKNFNPFKNDFNEIMSLLAVSFIIGLLILNVKQLLQKINLILTGTFTILFLVFCILYITKVDFLNAYFKASTIICFLTVTYSYLLQKREG